MNTRQRVTSLQRRGHASLHNSHLLNQSDAADAERRGYSYRNCACASPVACLAAKTPVGKSPEAGAVEGGASLFSLSAQDEVIYNDAHVATDCLKRAAGYSPSKREGCV